MVMLPLEEVSKVILTLTKTFAVLTFVPFTPLANLGPKEWLMHYFYPEIELEQYLQTGVIVFAFNTLLPAMVGLVISILKRWR